jgi:hypothetical protein
LVIWKKPIGMGFWSANQVSDLHGINNKKTSGKNRNEG